MSSKPIYSRYHYVYRITNLVERKHYYGVRSSKVHPSEDLGKQYFSSSTVKAFIKDQKENPSNYKYKVIRIFDTREEAAQLEIELHARFDVAINESFYNKAKQTATGWDGYGNKHSEETKQKMSVIKKGKVIVIDTETGDNLLCSKDDPNYISGRYVHNNVGKVTVRDTETGENLQCSKDDPLYLSGRYVPIAKDRVNVRDTVTGDTFQCTKDDPNYLSGRYISLNSERETSAETRKKIGDAHRGMKRSEEAKMNISESRKGQITVRDTDTGKTLTCLITDPNYISGKYVSVNKGKKRTDESKEKMSSKKKNKVVVRDTVTGENIQCSKDDPNYISGRYVPIAKGRKHKHPLKKCKYCGLEAAAPSIGRWHDENCKRKP